MGRFFRSTAAAVLSFAVLLAATGWLYLVRPHLSLPGPRVHDALPLDELSHRAAVPLLIFLAIWAVAGGLLGAVARWARTERLTAGLLLALGVGAWTYAVNGLSILVVRQIPAHQAFHLAAKEQAVVIPAALAGIGGAPPARPGRGCRSCTARSWPWSVCSPWWTASCRSTAGRS